MRPAIVSGIVTSGGSRPSDKWGGGGGRGGSFGSKNKGAGPQGSSPGSATGYWASDSPRSEI